MSEHPEQSSPQAPTPQESGAPVNADGGTTPSTSPAGENAATDSGPSGTQTEGAAAHEQPPADGEKPPRKRRRRRRRRKGASASAEESGAGESGASENSTATPSPDETSADAPAPSAEGTSQDAPAEPSADGTKASESAQAAEGDGEKPRPRRKRRRRRKKSKGQAGDGAGTEAGAADTSKDGSSKEGKSRDGSEGGEPPAVTGAFAQYLQVQKARAGDDARRHAFATGSIVAGRVERIENRVIFLDLFGKGSAVMDLDEPRTLAGVPTQAPAELELSVSVTPESSEPIDDRGQLVGIISPVLAEADADARALVTVEIPAAPKAEAEPAAEVVAEVAATPEAAPVPETAVADASPDETPAEEAAVATPVETAADAPSESAGDGTPTESESESGAAQAQAVAAAEEATEPTGAAPEAETVAAAAPKAPADAESETETETEAETKPKAVNPVALRAVAPTPQTLVAAGDRGPEECAPPQTGDILRGRVGAVSESGHMVILNRDIDKPTVRAAIKRVRDEKGRVTGLVFGFNRGGFDVLIAGVRVFCPASFMTLEPIKDPTVLIGQKLAFTVAPPRKGKGKGKGKSNRKLVVDRRSILKREARKALKARLRNLEVGHTVSAEVTGVRDFGLLVDIDGIAGLVHQSEISWLRNVRPSSVAKVGDTIQVKVIELEKVERGKGAKKTRVSLSLRALEQDPWKEHAALLKVGSVQHGTVANTTEVGAFIRLAPGIEGLLHISELGKDLSHARQALNDGDEIDVVVDRVDSRQRRLSLSKLSKVVRLAIAENRFALPKGARPSTKPGSHVKVLVDRVDRGGVAVQLRGMAGRRGRGFIPNRELGGKSNDEKKKTFAPGTELEVKILQSDRDRGLRCSIRGLEMDEERRALRKYQRESKKKGFGTLGELFGDKLRN